MTTQSVNVGERLAVVVTISRCTALFALAMLALMVTTHARMDTASVLLLAGGPASWVLTESMYRLRRRQLRRASEAGSDETP